MVDDSPINETPRVIIWSVEAFIDGEFLTYSLKMREKLEFYGIERKKTLKIRRKTSLSARGFPVEYQFGVRATRNSPTVCL